LARKSEDESAKIFRKAESEQIDPFSEACHLVADDLIAGADRFETVASSDVLARFNANFALDVGPIGRIERAIKGNAKFIGSGRPGVDWLGNSFTRVANFEDAAFAGGTGAPVGRTAVASDNEVASGTDAGIDREHGEGSEKLILGDVAKRRFGELRSVEFAAGFAANERIVCPMRGAEMGTAVDAFVKEQADGALVLRAVFVNGRFVDDIREMLRMARREAVVFASLDVQQFIKRIAVWQPGCAFLISGEEVALMIKCQSTGVADASANNFASRKIGADTLDRSAFIFKAITGFAGVFVNQVSLNEIRAAAAEVDGTVFGMNCEAEAIDIVKGIRPAGCDYFFLVGAAVAIFVEDEGNFAFAGNEYAVTPRVVLAREGNTDG
jgi:hypothetical protein